MSSKTIDCQYTDICYVTILDNNLIALHAISITSNAQIHLDKEQAIQLRDFLNEFIGDDNE